jgi:hypothetical protein
MRLASLRRATFYVVVIGIVIYRVSCAIESGLIPSPFAVLQRMDLVQKLPAGEAIKISSRKHSQKSRLGKLNLTELSLKPMNIDG